MLGAAIWESGYVGSSCDHRRDRQARLFPGCSRVHQACLKAHFFHTAGKEAFMFPDATVSYCCWAIGFISQKALRFYLEEAGFEMHYIPQVNINPNLQINNDFTNFGFSFCPSIH